MLSLTSPPRSMMLVGIKMASHSLFSNGVAVGTAAYSAHARYAALAKKLDEHISCLCPQFNLLRSVMSVALKKVDRCLDRRSSRELRAQRDALAWTLERKVYPTCSFNRHSGAWTLDLSWWERFGL